MLANYATKPETSKGRLFPEPEDKFRDCFQRDRDRIIHSSAFRKLMYKTQVFINYEGDYYRTRLTHSLEVAQIARSIARRLQSNEDLTEALALAHDIGHPPFGHAGEDALKIMTQNCIKFDHNAQALRILTELETKYINFNGLNLTLETLEGLAKHNGPIERPHAIFQHYNNNGQNLDLRNYSSIEAQIASLSDDIAYNVHDIDDGLRSKLIKLTNIMGLPIIGPNIDKDILNASANMQSRMIYQALRKMIAFLINDLVYMTEINIENYNIKAPEEVRKLGTATVHFSRQTQKDLLVIKKFLAENLYYNYKINRIKSKVKRIIKDLFELFVNEPECLPTEWGNKIKACESSVKNKQQINCNKRQVICDFISGMTDRFAIKEYQRLLDSHTLLQFDSLY